MPRAPRARKHARRRRGPATSLGVIFYELLAGTRPFEAQTPQAIMRQHLNMKPPALRERAPWVSEPLCQLVHSMLAKDGAKRPSMAQVQERLAVGSRSAALERLRHPAVIAVAFTLLSSSGWLLWRHHEHSRAGHPAVHAGPPPAAAPASVSAAGVATPAPADSAAVSPASDAVPPPSPEPVPVSTAPIAAAADPPPTPAPASAPAPARGTLPSASRALRPRGQRTPNRRVPAAAPAPDAKAKPASGILKAIDFGKH